MPASAKKSTKKKTSSSAISDLGSITKTKSKAKASDDFDKLSQLKTKKPVNKAESKSALSNLSSVAGKPKPKTDDFSKLSSLNIKKPATKTKPIIRNKPLTVTKPKLSTQQKPKSAPPIPTTRPRPASIPKPAPKPVWTTFFKPPRPELDKIKSGFDWNSFNLRLQKFFTEQIPTYFKNIKENIKLVPDQVKKFFQTFPMRWKESPVDEQVAWGCLGGSIFLFLVSIVLVIVI
jgi:hypothetical protein